MISGLIFCRLLPLLLFVLLVTWFLTSLDRVAAARRRRAGSGEARREETPPVPFLSPSVHVVATLLLLRPKASGERSETDGTRRMEREPSGRPFGASLVSHVPTVVRLSLRACGTPEGTEEE